MLLPKRRGTIAASLVRGELLRAVAGRGRRGGRGRSDFRLGRRGRRDRCGFGRRGGRVLSSGGGTRLALRAASRRGIGRTAGWSAPLSSLRASPTTPTRHHPPEIPSRTTSPDRSVSRPGSGSAGSRRPLVQSFEGRQTHICRQQRRSGRLQQPRRSSQREQGDSRNEKSLASPNPANPEIAHLKQSSRSEEFAPRSASDEEGPGAPPNGLYFFGDSSSDGRRRFTEKVERGGVPGPSSYATLRSRNSAISRSWSSTQSPGFRSKTSSFRRAARSRRSSGSIVSAL